MNLVSKRIIEKFKIEFNWLMSVFIPRKKQLAIFDKFYPDLSYTWRTAEFNYLLSYFKKSVLFSESINYKGHTTKTQFIERKKKLLKIYPDLRADKRIKYLNKPVFTYNFKYELVYFLFLEDAIRFFPYLNRLKTPFAFTLYPGGGFLIDNKTVDDKIKLICNSQLCRGVFVNGRFAKSYLIEKLKICESKITLVPGVPLYQNEDECLTVSKTENFVIGFCARKYHDRGLDKGFDVFARTALKLHQCSNLKFICIGDFSKEDLTEVEKQKTNIEFTGLLSGKQFKEKLSELDVIVSPVKNKLNGGDFDGFPTSAVVEASIQGVTMLCSDPLNDSLYKNGEEIFILNSKAEDYIKTIEYLMNNREYCRKIGLRGKARTLELYDDSFTLAPKLNKINTWLND
jgi:glycosyltransferase involved in cell wall biosynthesis